MRPIPRPCPYCKQDGLYRLADWRDGFGGASVWIDPLTAARHECPDLERLYAVAVDKAALVSPHALNQAAKDAHRIAVLEEQLKQGVDSRARRFKESQDAALRAFKERERIAAAADAAKLLALQDRLDEEATTRDQRFRLFHVEQAAATQAQVDEIVAYEEQLADRRITFGDR